MSGYRLYHFDRFHIERADNIFASDDQEAVKKASKLIDGQMAELWQEARKVETFNPEA